MENNTVEKELEEKLKQTEAKQAARSAKLGCLSILATPFWCVYLSFVLKTGWAWFMVPMFGLPAIGLAGAFGLSILFWLFKRPEYRDTKGYNPESVDLKDPKFIKKFIKDMKDALWFQWLYPGLALLVMWFTKKLM